MGSTGDFDKLNKRIKTFLNWSGRKTSTSLASAGFAYTGVSDKVECESCGIRLYNWQDEEDPLLAHKKYSPDCQFLRENFPHVKAPEGPKPVHKVKYPHYADYEARLMSFNSWPLKSVAQKPEFLAKSGFFYIGSADRARCFHCGVTLRDWDTDDYPPTAHKQWSENCPFVMQLSVDDLVTEIEEEERLQKFKESDFIDCHPKMSHSEEVVTDAVGGTQVHTQASHLSEEDSGFNPALEAVKEMGYSQSIIEEAMEVRKREGLARPSAMSLLQVILDLEE